MDPLFWSILLLLTGLLLVIAEVFVPSGGVIGFLSVSAIVSSIFLAFHSRGLEVGLIFLCITGFAVPVTVALAFRWWPKTPLGRRLLLNVPRGDELLPDDARRRTLRSMVGKIGTASSVMLPSGAIEIGGLTVDAVSDGTVIEPGTRVLVIDVRSNRVLVRPVTEEEDVRQPVADDVLSQSIESLGLDPFEDPLA